MERNPDKIYLTPTVVRIWHWVNALGIVTLCLTGVQIRFPDYASIFGSYKNAIRLHDTAGIVVSFLYLLWLGYYLFVAKSLGKLYVPTWTDLRKGLVRQVHYYVIDYFKGRPCPHKTTPDNKFNPLQKTAYMFYMLVLLPLVIISGVLLLNLMPLRRYVLMAGGLNFLVGAHFLLACFFVAFLCVHIYLATMGHSPLAHFKTMWTGWEEMEPRHPHGMPEKGAAYLSHTSR